MRRATKSPTKPKPENRQTLPESSRFPEVLRVTAIGIALAFTGVYLVLAILRMGYAFELEWIEGGSLSMVRRVLDGRPLYDSPSLSYIPFNYPPLYYWLSGLAARVLGLEFTALRLVSFAASLACGALIFSLVWAETKRRSAGVLAVGLFFATYRLAGAWLDVARVDSLHLALVLSGFLLLRVVRAPLVAGVAAGAILTLAFLTKQSALVAAFPMAVYLLFSDRTRGIAFAGSMATLVIASVFVLDSTSGGWFRYYVFELAGKYAPQISMATQFWRVDFAGPLAFCILAGLFAFLVPPEGAGRGRGITFAAIVGLLVSSWTVRAYPATYDNVLLPACAAAALMLGLGWDAAQSSAQRWGSRYAPRLTAFAGIAVVLQFVALSYNPLQQLPDEADVAAGERIVENLALTDGPALVPCHDYLSVRAGKGEHFHEMAFMAVAKSGDDTTAVRLRRQLREAVQDRFWSWIILDTRDWLFEELAVAYEPRFNVVEEGEMWPVTGMRRRPESMFVPKAAATDLENTSLGGGAPRPRQHQRPPPSPD